MKLVVDIPDDVYGEFKEGIQSISNMCIISNAVFDGQVLPKRHNCNEDNADCDQFVCSECGIELQGWYRVERDVDDGDTSYHEYVFRFCPNCGAKMEVQP